MGHIADYHFAPTNKSKENLIKDGISDKIKIVTNTVIDALMLGIQMLNNQDINKYLEYFNQIDFNKKIILVTGHRRENFGLGMENICNAIKKIAKNNEDVEIVYPVHLNPNVREPVNRILSNDERIHLIEPLDYPYLIWLMSKSYLVLTDSGGIQEEAPTLGKPVLVMRDVSERMEGIEAGTAKLVGTMAEMIYYETQKLLDDEHLYQLMSKAHNPYGDGHASERIVNFFLNLDDKNIE